MSDIPKDVSEEKNNLSKQSDKLSELQGKSSKAVVSWIILSTEELQASIKFDGKDDLKLLRSQVENPALKDCHIIYDHLKECNWKFYDGVHGWINVAYDILRDSPEEKVIVGWWFSIETLLDDNERSKVGMDGHYDKLLVLLASKNFKYVQLPVDSDTLNSCFDKEQSSEASLEDLQKSFNFDFLDMDVKEILEKEKKEITNEYLFWAYFVDVLYTSNGEHGVQEFYWIDVAYDILQKDPTAKTVLIDTFALPVLKQATNRNKGKLYWLLENNQCRHIKIGSSLTDLINDLNNAFTDTLTPNKEVVFEAEKRIANTHIATIRHSLEPYKIKDPYNPKNINEERHVQHAFELTKKYFPGLDNIEKMLDYMMNVNIDIPEVMKWERIEWVYVDIDWTLIDYVPIGSPLEWTQQLRQPVVELLKKYEREWKKVIIWTWGNVEMKEKYIRSLWITWPVVSKYDYAWAIAEIVVDDTDKSAFILQSKIMPEVYIDTRNM